VPTFRFRLSGELEKIAGIEKIVLSGKHSGFTIFRFGGKEIGHFDNDNEFDLRLTKQLIKQEGLMHPPTSKNHPNRSKTLAHWIVLQFSRAYRIKEIVRLVKLLVEQK